MSIQRVGVIFGGQSCEHEVSIVSGHAILNHLDPERFLPIPIGITRDGTWMWGQGVLATLLSQCDRNKLPPEVSWNLEHGPTFETSLPAAHTWHPRLLFEQLGIDVLFPVLHGPCGEDGTVQGIFTLAGLPYVGCGVAASAIAMDKAHTKVALAHADIPPLPWLLITRRQWHSQPSQVIREIEATLTYPVFVKPANLGSSIGISRATNRTELHSALQLAGRYDHRIVVEQGIAAREIEVSILGNDEPEASMTGEIVPSDEWYTYDAKYLAGRSLLHIPAPIDPAMSDKIRDIACRAFVAIGGTGLARIDFLLDRTNDQVWLNEINTMPGFTPISMYPKLWEASGLPYRTLLTRLITLASEQHQAHTDMVR